MPSIIYKTDPKTGNTFAYRSTSYRDPITKRPRSRQEYLGRVDPVSKEILPKGTDGKRNRSSSARQLNNIESRIGDMEKELSDSKRTIEYLQKKVKSDDRFFDTIKEAIRQQEETLALIESGNNTSESEVEL